MSDSGPGLTVRRFLATLGPGILFAATSIGASHLVLAPRAGMLYGAELLWLVILAHALKYPAFDLGPRYAMAAGESLLAGYARLPGRWPLWCFVVFTVLQGIGVAVAVTSVTASVLAVSFGDWPPGLDALHLTPLSFWGIVVSTASVGLILVGRNRGMEILNNFMMAALLVLTVVVFAVKPTPASYLVHLVVPALPAGSLVLAAAVLGWMPTGIDVSIWHSMWALEKKGRWASLGKGPDRLGLMRSAMLDMRVGYALSIVTGVIFYLLGTHIKLEGTAPDGARVAAAISTVYVDALGSWAFPLFMAAAFFAMFSTTYIVMDGFPRSLAESLRLLVPSRRSSSGLWSAPYIALLVVVWVSVIPILVLVPKPVFIVKSAALLSFLVAPLYYGLNVFCASRFIPPGPLRPSRAWTAICWTGAALMAVSSLIFIVSEL